MKKKSKKSAQGPTKLNRTEPAFSICLSVSCHFCLARVSRCEMRVSRFKIQDSRFEIETTLQLKKLANWNRNWGDLAKKSANQVGEPIDWHCPQRPFANLGRSFQMARSVLFGSFTFVANCTGNVWKCAEPWMNRLVDRHSRTILLNYYAPDQLLIIQQ